MKGVPASTTDFGTATVREGKIPPPVDVAAVARQAAMAPHTLSIGPITPAGRWVVTIPGWIPVSDNRLVGAHYMKAHRLKKADADRIFGEVVLAGVPPATGRRRVGVVITCPNMSRAPDSGNINKSLRDALVGCRAIRDDGPEWAEFTEPVVEKGKKATVITIEDV